MNLAGMYGHAYYIKRNKETGKGISVQKVSGGNVETIFRAVNGYILSESTFNRVNYNGDTISIHVRTAETSNSD